MPKKLLKRENIKRMFGIALAAVMVLAMASCPGTGPETNSSPVPADYDITGLTQTADGQAKEVTITPKEGKSEGAITIYYEGTDGTTYEKSTTAPGAAGTYAVTFDVAEDEGWDAATGLAAGTLTISAGNLTPVAGDYDITGLTQTADGEPKEVTINPKAGKSTGAITIYYEGTDGTTYEKSTDAPSALGKYAVTFDVAEAEGWNAAPGLDGGILIINNTPTPAASDYDVTGLTQTYDGEPKEVTITPKADKSSGARTVYYEGTDGTAYEKSTTAPSAAGKYNVTFDAAEAEGWNAVKGLQAGTLIIIGTPVAADYDISGLTQTYDGQGKTVTINPKAGKSAGARTVYYEGTDGTTYTKSTTAPSTVGKYKVTFNVAEAEGWEAAAGLTAGTLTISNAHTHTWGAEWKYNATQHWKECTSGDGAKTEVANHTGDPCTVCGYSGNSGETPINLGTGTVFNISGKFNDIGFRLIDAPVVNNRSARAIGGENYDVTGALADGGANIWVSGAYDPEARTYSVSTSSETLGKRYSITGTFDSSGNSTGSTATMLDKGAGDWATGASYSVDEDAEVSITGNALPAEAGGIPAIARGNWYSEGLDSSNNPYRAQGFINQWNMVSYKATGVGTTDYATTTATVIEVENIGGGKYNVILAYPLYATESGETGEAQIDAAISEFFSDKGVTPVKVEDYMSDPAPYYYIDTFNWNFVVKWGSFTESQWGLVDQFYSVNYLDKYLISQNVAPVMAYKRSQFQFNGDNTELKIAYWTTESANVFHTLQAARDANFLDEFNDVITYTR